MHLSYSLNRDDLVRASRLQMNFWQYLFVVCIIACAWTFVSVVGNGIPITFSADFLMPQVVAPLFLGLFLTLGVRYILIPWRIALLHRQNPLLYRDLELFIDEQGVRVKGPRVDAKWEWSDVRGLKENMTTFLLCVSRSLQYPVPKRALSIEEGARFRGLLEQHLKKI
jgi:hypothetical protein